MKIIKRMNIESNFNRLRSMTSNIYAGASVENGEVYFTWNSDNLDTDLVALATSEIHEIEDNDTNINIVYAYEFLPNTNYGDQKVFRDHIKYLGTKRRSAVDERDQDVVEFIHRGLDQFSRNYNINSFNALVHIKPSKTNSIVSEMTKYFSMMKSGEEPIDFTLVKQMYKNVTFDIEKARMKMQEVYHNPSYIEERLQEAVEDFEELKTTNMLFEMKKFVPRPLREGFENYLAFSNPRDKWMYEKLQNSKILIYDDLLTSGATVKEAVRYLRSINGSHEFTVFVLVKQ